MGYRDRLKLINRIADLRGSIVFCYLTTLRPGLQGMIADDAVRVFFDHLLQLPKRPIAKLDLFLCSNGGHSTVPWRLVALFREYTESFNVLIPYRAYSAATLIALGADEIVMHPFGEMGPIDPSVSNEFNPRDPATGRLLGISVEDVKAYVNFIKETVGITHQEELIRAIEQLTSKVHPIAIGNIERFLSQSRMIANKILRTHMTDADDYVINEIVENLASKLYFHGHPINRREAKNDLRLKVLVDPTPELEAYMWDLYLNYEHELSNTILFSPASDLAFSKMTSPNLKEIKYELIHAIIESESLSSRYTTSRKYTELEVPQQPGQLTLKEEILAQGWSHESAQAAEGRDQP